MYLTPGKLYPVKEISREADRGVSGLKGLSYIASLRPASALSKN